MFMAALRTSYDVADHEGLSASYGLAADSVLRDPVVRSKQHLLALRTRYEADLLESAQSAQDEGLR
jgi:hypothetical protein